MTPDERLERAAEGFADTVYAMIAERVRVSVELEHDRHDAELAELREQVAAARMETARLFELHARVARTLTEHDLQPRPMDDATVGLHSVRVDP